MRIGRSSHGILIGYGLGIFKRWLYLCPGIRAPRTGRRSRENHPFVDSHVLYQWLCIETWKLVDAKSN